ncbi:hypothetical protein BN3590_02747 [Clostridium sp. C105KSO15]|nr:hypothetical protein BN3590_02747 [Clostridium sp. C105KSO15]
MKEYQIHQLKINKNYKCLIPTISAEEMRELEHSLKYNGCHTPLYVWKGIILDGHKRYEICTRLKIPFKVHYLHFKINEEATIWVCINQLGRKNLTDGARRYIIGKRFEAEKILDSFLMLKGKLTEHANERLSKEYQISYASLRNYDSYAHALDTFSKIIPELLPKTLTGEIKIPIENMIALYKHPYPDISKLKQLILDDEKNMAGYANMRKLFQPRQDNGLKTAYSPPAGSIKDMPAYDPDAEISSLTFTIPSWISSINRTYSVTNLDEISYNACCKLETQLLLLMDTINTLLKSVKEKNNG